jgi:sarcosine oxidase, subunit gamma
MGSVSVAEQTSTSTPPIARSPIAQMAPVAVVEGWEVSQRTSEAALTVADVTALAKVVVHAPESGAFAAAIGVPFGRAQRRADGVLVIGSSPGEWLLLGAPGTASTLEAGVPASAPASVGELVTVVDVTHGRALLRLTGADAVRLMAKICAIDLDDRVTPNLSALRTSVAKLVTDLVRDDRPDGTRSYLLHCDRSSGQVLFDAVVDAGTEHGIEVTGFHT